MSELILTHFSATMTAFTVNMALRLADVVLLTLPFVAILRLRNPLHSDGLWTTQYLYPPLDGSPVAFEHQLLRLTAYFLGLGFAFRRRYTHPILMISPSGWRFPLGIAQGLE